MVEDDEGRVWFGTDNGALRWDGRALEPFTVHRGLIGAETNRAAGLIDSRKRVWIGTDRGVSVYHEVYDRPRPGSPEVRFLDLEAGGETMPIVADRALRHDENELIYRFRAIAFIDEQEVRFRYRLEGFDTEWQGPDLLPQREIRYTNLSPGVYRMHLQAIDVEEGRSAVVVSPTVTILKPLWTRSWFIALVFAGVVAMIYGLGSLLWHRRYARDLEHEVRARTEALRDSEREVKGEKERLAVTLASITDGVAATDVMGRIVVWNPAAERITGWSRDAAIGRRLEKVLAVLGGEAGPSAEETGDLLAGGGEEQTLTIRDQAGTARVLELSSAPIGGRAASGAVLAFRDVTERRQIEQELAKAQKLEAIGVLAGGIAHDFNNLLTVVLGNLSLLEEDAALPAASRSKIEGARSASQRARSLTQLRESATFALSGSSVGFRIHLPGDLWVVEIDEGQMSQVLHNLLINARQAMPAGGTIEIRAKNLDVPPLFLGAGRHVVIEIEDEGNGIPSEDLERVFDPYFTTKEGGSGLGLTSAYSIVARHDGRLTIDSTPGQGTVVCIYLPASTGPVAAVEGVEGRFPGGSGRVLVMDDEQSVRTVMLEILTRHGYVAVGADDGEEAVRLYRRALDDGRPFDAVIVDLTVPGGMGGREAVERLREIDPHVRAIVVSGYSNDPVMANHTEYGFSAGLGKPFRFDELLRVVGRVIAVPREADSSPAGSESSRDIF
jgi:PAS domain S-box-containing protein